MFSRRFSDLKPYVPGEQPSDREYIKLNANENPYPPSPAIEKALREFPAVSLRLYPDPDSHDLREAIAEMLGDGITADMIFPGNGSDEILSFIFYTFFDSDSPVAFPTHTYSFYPVYAGYYNIRESRVPLRDDFSIDTDRLADSDSCGIIFPNPNAPTGIPLSLEEVRVFLGKCAAKNPSRAVVIDEAYIDFGGETALPLLNDFPNLVIVRTFSKSFCFAGARLGFAVSRPENIDALFTTKNSFNHFPVDKLTQRLGIAACSDAAYYKRICGEIAVTRDRFAEDLKTLGWRVLPSKANFVFASHPSLSGRDIYEAAKKAGFLLRVFDTPGIERFVRITIGTPQHMQNLTDLLKKHRHVEGEEK